MKYRQYRFKFYLNASHSIIINGKLGESHPHTWEITLSAVKLEEEFIIFSSVEKDIEHFLNTYQDSYLNEKDPFNVINPTLENICGVFKEKMNKLLFEKSWLLLSIEMSETPARSYVIDNRQELVGITDEELEQLIIAEEQAIEKGAGGLVADLAKGEQEVIQKVDTIKPEGKQTSGELYYQMLFKMLMITGSILALVLVIVLVTTGVIF